MSALSKFCGVTGRLLSIGAACLGGAAFGRHVGLSRKLCVLSTATALGVTQLLVSAFSSVNRRRENMIIEEKESATQISNLMDWNEALGALRKIVDTFSHGLAAPFTLKHLLLDAELLRQHHTRLFEELVARDWEASNVKDLCDGRYFANFAMSSYGFTLLKLLGLIEEPFDMFRHGARAVDVVKHQLGLSDADILIANLDGDELGVPRHFVARDVSTRSIVVVVRGTNSLSDVLVDLLCDCAPFSKGYAHSGMKDAAEALFTATLPTIRSALDANRGFKLVTVGHSMGAGVAILLTKVFLDFGFKGVTCFAISPPPVYGPMDSVDDRWSRALNCFVHSDDIVPRLSLESARALVMEIERVEGPPLSDRDLRGLGSGSLLAAISSAEKQGLTDRREKLVAPLFIPTSQVHWILECNGLSSKSLSSPPAFRSVRADVSVFSRMLLTRCCVTSHFPNTYISAFENMGLPPRLIPKRHAGERTPCRDPPLYYDGELGR